MYAQKGSVVLWTSEVESKKALGRHSVTTGDISDEPGTQPRRTVKPIVSNTFYSLSLTLPSMPYSPNPILLSLLPFHTYLPTCR